MKLSARARRLAPSFVLLACAAAAGCMADEPGQSVDDLTSLSARSRSLTFEGYVYVSPDASDSAILSAVRKQTQTAFGALRTAEIGVNDRELKNVDPATFVKEPVTVIDTASSGAGEPMLRVRYRYDDMAVVPKAMVNRSAINLALLSPGYGSQIDRILKECTANDAEAQDFASSLWYVFDPSLSSCRKAIAAEQQAIDTAAEGLDDAATQVVKQEAERLYLPTTIALGADQTNKGKSWPEYDRLYRGGVQPGKLVISLVNGFIDHGATSDYTDSGYREWFTELRESFRSRPSFHLASIDPPEDLASFEVNGTPVTGVDFDDFLSWELDQSEWPAGLSYYDHSELRRQVGDKLIKHWLTFEADVTVSIGDEAPQPVTLQILTYFGAGSSSTPHKHAIKNSDVFIYNGHSYIGYGPLDPSNFSPSDFPESYQILFIDGCVSYNYYEKDYFPLKAGGTKNLELITNGLEAPAWKSGYALGRFVSVLLDGHQASYRDLLQAASATDSLRVVDGELDNAYRPDQVPIVVE